MTTISIAANCISQPQFFPAGSLVTVTPASGATATVEYTVSDEAAVRNGVAVWSAWSSGAVTTATTDLLGDAAYLRITATGGAVSVDVDTTPSAARLQAYKPDWGAPAVFSRDSSGNVTGLVGPDGAVVATPCISFGSGLPFVYPSSGSIGNNGALTGVTGFNYTIGQSYAYFPANAIFAGSVAGWYYTVFSSATAGTIYNNKYTTGTPAIPDSPTAFVTTGPGAYTQSTGTDITGPNAVIPANFLGNNGFIEWQRFVNSNNSAGTKVFNTYFGGQLMQGVSQTTNPYEAGMGTVKNRGRKTAQISANSAHGDVANASGLKFGTADTAQNQLFSMTINLNTATDYGIIESFAIKAFKVS